MIRAAEHRDACAIHAIHVSVVKQTYAIFRDQPLALAEVENWLATQVERGFDFLVAENSAHEVVGFATYVPFRSVSGYASTVENAVHVAPEARGQGWGKALMKGLLEKARQRGLHLMVAAIDSENAASVQLHAQLGFVIVGQMPEVAKKNGCFRTLTLMQAKL